MVKKSEIMKLAEWQDTKHKVSEFFLDNYDNRVPKVRTLSRHVTINRTRSLLDL